MTPTGARVYDAVTVCRYLGFSTRCNAPVPAVGGGGIVVYYGGWDLRTLRSSSAGKRYLHQDQVWYENYEWRTDPGYYGLLLPVPRSNQKTWKNQLRSLASIDPVWEPAPVCLAVTMLLVQLTEVGISHVPTDFCRCREPVSNRCHVALCVSNNRVHISGRGDGVHAKDLWVAGSRTF